MRSPMPYETLDRSLVIPHLRDSIRAYLIDVEERAGTQVVFQQVPHPPEFIASYVYDTSRGLPCIRLAYPERDCEVAHEVGHMEHELLRGFAIFEGCERPCCVERARCLIQGAVNDEAVHHRLAELGLKFSGCVVGRGSLESFRDVAERLKAKQTRPYDGMAHSDRLGRGTLYRAKRFIWALRLLNECREYLSPDEQRDIARFIKHFRLQRKPEAKYAERVYSWFRRFDVLTADGSAQVLRRWAELEGIGEYGRVERYHAKSHGGYELCAFEPDAV